MKVKLFGTGLVLLAIVAGLLIVIATEKPKIYELTGKVSPISVDQPQVEVLLGFQVDNLPGDESELNVVYQTGKVLKTQTLTIPDSTVVSSIIRSYLADEARIGNIIHQALSIKETPQARVQIDTLLGERTLGDLLIENGFGLSGPFKIPMMVQDSAVEEVVTFEKGVGKIGGREIKVYSLAGYAWELQAGKDKMKLYQVGNSLVNTSGTFKMTAQ